jgi:hypothetical protein
MQPEDLESSDPKPSCLKSPANEWHFRLAGLSTVRHARLAQAAQASCRRAGKDRAEEAGQHRKASAQQDALPIPRDEARETNFQQTWKSHSTTPCIAWGVGTEKKVRNLIRAEEGESVPALGRRATALCSTPYESDRERKGHVLD